MGHQERFPPPSLRDRCGSREGTFAGARTNGRHAPIPDLRGLNRTYLSKLEKGASYPGLEINAKLSTGWRSCEPSFSWDHPSGTAREWSVAFNNR